VRLLSSSTRLQRFLASDRATHLAYALALVLGLATIVIGFYSDDWALIAMLERKVHLHSSPLDLYRFGTGDPAETRELVVRGPWPWWSLPELRLHFFRPLASALFSLDHALFGTAPLGWHLHAVLWWLVFVAAARAVYRRTLPAAAAGVALVAFVLDDAHVQPIGWLSCRHMLIGATPALLGLVAHLRWREDGFRPGRALALVGLGVGLLGSEAALGIVGYFVAYELVGRRDALRTKLAALVPPLALCLAYVVGYKALGFGASGSGMYIEPFADPLGFTAMSLTRIPILAGDLLFTVPADFSNVLGSPPFVVIGLAALAAAAWLVRGAWASLSEAERRTVLWLGMGALAGIPVGLSGFPGSRVLLLPSVGAFGVLGLLVERTLLAARRAPVAAGAFVVLHGVFGPLLFATGVAMHARMARATERANETLSIAPPLPKRVYVLVASDPMAAFYASAVRLVRGPRDYSAWSILSMSKRVHRVTRTGESSVRLETPEGTLFDGGFVHVYRAAAFPMHAGDVVGLDGGSVTVLTASDGAPTAIDLVLDVPLDDPTIAILTWQDGALRHVNLAVGESMEVVWSPGPTMLF
jgi:hypothetical protein